MTRVQKKEMLQQRENVKEYNITNKKIRQMNAFHTQCGKFNWDMLKVLLWWAST